MSNSLSPVMGSERAATIAQPANNAVAPADEAAASSTSTAGGVTRRVVALCLLLAVFFGYIIPIVDIKLSNTFLGATHLPTGAIAALLVLLLVVNPLLHFVSRQMSGRRLAFSRNEALTVYISCLFSCLVPGQGSENFFVSTSIASFYYATRENKWLDFLQSLKPWFTPALGTGTYDDSGRRIVEGWYSGLRAGDTIPWDVWMVPLLAWGSFVFASYIMLGCLGVMLRAQWAEHEALTFPLLRLPLEMTEDVDRPDRYGVVSRFFRNPMMWVGFGIAAFIQLVNGLNLYFPDVPRVPLSMDVGPFYSEAPWNQTGTGAPVYIYPIAVGITYLLTSEVSFSLWFFLWFIKLEHMAAYYVGYPVNSLPSAIGANVGKLFTEYQRLGCYLAYAAIVLWTGREHFRHILHRAFHFLHRRTPASENEKSEALSYPVAFWGFVLSFAFMVIWSVFAGLRLDLAVALWVSYLVIAIALTRVVVEGGILMVEHHWAPLGAAAQLVGSGPGTWLSPANGLVPAAFLQGAMITNVRAFLLPSFVQSFKLAHDRKIKPKPLLALIFAVISITLVMSVWMNIRIGYESGCLRCDEWYARSGAPLPALYTSQLINGAANVSWANWLWMGSGVLLTYGIMLARSRFMWFPLHPIGLLMSLTYSAYMLWFSILLGWLCKGLITRFGGTDAYRKTVPTFLGLALGDVTMMLFWLCIDGWQGRTGHRLIP